MDLLRGVQELLNRIFHFPIIQEADILFLGQNMDCKRAVISNLLDEVSSEHSTSWEFSKGEIKFNFFDLGEYRIARRAWSDYGAKMDAVVYFVNADALTQEELLGPGEEPNAQLWEHFQGPREELNALLSDEAFSKARFLIFGLIPAAVLFPLTERLCYFLGLPNVAIELVAANAHRIKVFVAEAFHAEEHLDGFRWLSQPNLKEANILVLGQNVDRKRAVISNLLDELSSEHSTSWEFSNGEIKFNFFDLGDHRIAHRAWSDYGAKMDAVVYIVNADALTQEEPLGPGEEPNAQLWEHFRGPREELNALLSDEAFSKAPFLIFGLIPTGALFPSTERLCYFLELPNVTIELVAANAHPIKVFVAEALHAEEYLDGFRWLSHYLSSGRGGIFFFF